METVSIRKKANETIIIQNSKRVFKHLLTTIIGIYCLFNLLGISLIDITYKFFFNMTIIYFIEEREWKL